MQTHPIHQMLVDFTASWCLLNIMSFRVIVYSWWNTGAIVASWTHLIHKMLKTRNLKIMKHGKPEKCKGNRYQAIESNSRFLRKINIEWIMLRTKLKQLEGYHLMQKDIWNGGGWGCVGVVGVTKEFLKKSNSYQWYGFKWKTWQLGWNAIFEEACLNFLVAGSFSSKFICIKYLTHQVLLRIFAFKRNKSQFQAPQFGTISLKVSGASGWTQHEQFICLASLSYTSTANAGL